MIGTVPRMVPIKTASRESGISYDRIRKLCLTGKIVFIRSGNKFLINMDRFIDYLNGENHE